MLNTLSKIDTAAITPMTNEDLGAVEGGSPLAVPVAKLPEAEAEEVHGGAECTVGTSGANCTFTTTWAGIEKFLFAWEDVFGNPVSRAIGDWAASRGK